MTLNGAVVGMAADSTGSGYWEVASSGGVFAAGNASFAGSMGGSKLVAPVVGIAPDSASGGYWEAAADGGIFSFNAPFLGSMGGHPLVRPVVGIASTPDGHGYWEVASDGGIFTFGDAHFYGSMGGHPLAKPVVGIAATPDGHGYWEVASDGGIFTFGDAHFYGSMGGHPLAKPVVGIASTPDGHGYWEVGSDGGIFTFGDAHFYGSMGGHPLAAPMVGVSATPTGSGYWEVGANGGIFTFGNARFNGAATTGTAPAPPAAPSSPAAGYVPPANPPDNVAPNPPYTFESGQPYNASQLACWALGSSAWIPESSTTQCLTAEVEATNAARAQEGVGPISLPSNWSSLTPEEQLFVLTDIERVSRGEQPVAGLSATVNAYAQQGASARTDPQFSFAAIPSSNWWGSNWVGGALNALDANYTWMYEDGYGGYNIDCRTPGGSGCWGHRDNVLTSTYGGTLVMGAGQVTMSTGLESLSELFVAVQNRGDVPALYYTWAEAVAAGAGG